MLLPVIRATRSLRRVVSLVTAICLVTEPALADAGYYFRLSGTGSSKTLAVKGPPIVYGHVGGTVGGTYKSVGGSAPYLWGLKDLPTWLTIRDGVLAGTPSTGGTYHGLVTLADGDGATAVEGIEVDVFGTLAVRGTADLETGVGADAASAALTVTGTPVQPVAFGLASGQVPPGMAVDPVTGSVTGAPTATGVYTLSVVATDATGSDAVSASFTITVDDSLPAESGPGKPLVARAGSPYASPYPRPVPGSKAPVTYALATGTLPPGYAIDAATGRVMGTTPAATPDMPFTIRATDAVGRVGTQTRSISVLPPLSFPAPGAGAAYVGYLRDGVVGSYAPPLPGPRPQVGTWALASGTLPPGVTLSEATGAVTGRPTAPTAPMDVADAIVTLAFHESTGSTTTTPPITLHTYGPLYLGNDDNLGLVVGVAGAQKPVPYTGRYAGDHAWAPVDAYGRLVALPRGMGMDPATGAVAGTPDYGFSLGLSAAVTDLTGTFPTNAFGVAALAKFPMGAMAGATARVGVARTLPAPKPGPGWEGSLSYATDGPLPAGLAIDAATGVISGTPTKAATATVAIVATDATGARSGTNKFAIQVYDGLGVAAGDAPSGVYATAPLAYATHQGFAFAIPLAATNGAVAPVTWSVDPATPLPDGVSLVPGGDRLTATLQGRLFDAGDDQVAIHVKDGAGTDGAGTVSLRVVPPLSATGPTLKARVGTTIDPKSSLVYGGSDPGTVANAVGPASWTLPADGSTPPPGLFYETLPAGADGVTQLSGRLSGVAQGPAGTVETVIGIADAVDSPDQPSRALSSPTAGSVIDRLDLARSPVGSITGHAGLPIAPTDPLTVTSDPVEPVSFAVTGTLPDGIRFASDTGVLSGTPTAAATTTVAVFGIDGILERTPAYFVTIAIDQGIAVGDGTPLPPVVGRVGTPVAAVTPPAVSAGAQRPLTWSLVPPVDGVTLDADGVLGGTPTSPVSGQARYRVMAADGEIGLSDPFQVAVRDRLSVVVQTMTSSLGFPVDVTLPVPKPDPALPLTYAAGPLPDGLSIDPATGRVTGTPTTLGTTTVAVAIDDGAHATADATFTWKVTPPISVTSGGDVTTHVGANVLVAAPTFSPATPLPRWSLADGTSLPDGMSIESSTGAISGKPTTAGRSVVRLVATDPQGLTGMGGAFAITVNPALVAKPIAAEGVKPYAGREGLALTVKAFTVAGGTGTISAKAVGDTPSYFKVTNDGTLGSTPPEGSAGDHVVTVEFDDEDGESITASVLASIVPPLALAVPGMELVLGGPNAVTLPNVANTPKAPISWTFRPVPDGMTFDGPTQTLSGTPTKPVTTRTTASGVDAEGAKFTTSFDVAVRGPLSLALDSPTAFGHRGQPFYVKAPTVGTNPKLPLSFDVAEVAEPGDAPAATWVVGADGSLTGTGLVETVFQELVSVTDGFGAKVSQPLKVTVLPPLAVDTVDDATRRVGQGGLLMQAPGVTGNPVTPLSWTYAGALPPGITLDPAVGTLSGTGTGTGDFPLQLTVTDATGATATTNTFVVSMRPQISIGPIASLVIHVGDAVSIDAPALGNDPVTPIGWWLDHYLPAGVYFDTKTGRTAGTALEPLAATHYGLIATDATGSSNTSHFDLTVVPTLILGQIPDLTASVGHNVAITQAVANVVGTATFVANLPDGLKIDPASGDVSGEPTAAGTTTVTVTVADGDGETASRSFVLTVVGTFALDIGSTATTRVNTRATIPGPTPRNAVPPVGLFVIAPGYALPVGLTMNPTDGSISGTPTVVGTSQVAYQATDGEGRVATSNPLTVTVNSPLSIGSAGSFVLRDGVRAVVPAPTVGNGPGPGTWSLATGTTLPAGFGLDAKTGAVTGTPGPDLDGTSATVTLTFTEDQGNSITDNGDGQPAVLTFRPPLGLGTVPTLYAHQGQGFSYGPVAVSGSPLAPLAWTLASGTLPTGLRVSPTTGVISGTVSGDAQGTSGAVVGVTDATHGTAVTASFDVKVLPSLSIAAAADASAHAGVAATFAPPTLSNGSPNAVWSLGTPEPGFSVDPATGVIRTDATAVAGAYPETLTVTDGAASVATNGFTITLLPALSAVGPTSAVLIANQTGTVPAPTVSNAVGQLHASLASGTLPLGMSVDPTSGKLTGTPTQTGNFSVSIRVSDDTGTATTTGADAIAVAAGSAATTYPASATVTNGASTTAASIAALYDGASATTTSVPANAALTLTFAAPVAADGVVDGETTPATVSYNAGTPASPAWTPLAATAVSATQFKVTYGTAATLGRVRLGLGGRYPASLPSITQGARQTPVVGAATSIALDAVMATRNGGAETWAITSGTLPDGLNLKADGTIAGTPTTLGSRTVTLTVATAAGIPSVPASLTIDPQSAATTASTYPVAAYDVGSGATPSDPNVVSSGLNATSTTIPVALAYDALDLTRAAITSAMSNYNSPNGGQSSSGAYGSQTWSGVELDYVSPVSFDGTLDLGASNGGTATTYYDAGTTASPSWVVYVPAAGPVTATRFQVVQHVGYDILGGPGSAITRARLGYGGVVPAYLPSLVAAAATVTTQAPAGVALATLMPATNASGAPTYAVSSGTLPAGLALAPDGTISGTATATASGVVTVQVTARDGRGLPSVPVALTITVNAPPAITAANRTLALGRAASVDLPSLMALSNGTSPAWTSTTLPAGLTLSTAGVLSGVPTAGGPSSVTVTVTNSTGLKGTATLALAIDVPPSLSSAAASTAAGSAASIDLGAALSASGLQSPTYVTTGLPSPLVASSAGLVTGTPTTAGTSSVSVTVTNADGLQATATLTLTISTPAPAAAPTGGLVALWHFDEGSGSIVSDAVGGHDLTITASPAWSTGVSGNAATFSGSNTARSTAWSQPGGASPRTISTWIRTTTAATSDLVFEGGSTAGTYLALSTRSDGSIGANTGSGITAWKPSSGSYADGAWHNLALVYDGTTTTAYMDGVVAGSTTTLSYATTTPSVVGVGYNVVGSMDETGMWNRALSASEVAALYAAKAVSASQTVGNGLLAMFHMDEGAGNTTTDSVVGRVATFGSVAPTWSTGASGRGVSFSGNANSQLTAPWGQLTGNASRTLSTWFKTTSSATAMLAGWGGTGTNGYFGINVQSGGTSIGVTGYGTGDTGVNTAKSFFDGAWHNAVATFDGTNVRIYLDGALLTTRATSYATTASTLKVGADLGSNFTGTIDETAVWSRALGAGEVASLYASGTPAVVQPTVNLTQGQLAFYRFEEGTGTTSADATGAYNLNLTNATWVSPGKVGGGVSFAGNGGGASTTNEPLTQQAPMTESGWFKTTAKPSSYQSIIAFGQPTGNQYLELFTTGTGAVVLNAGGTIVTSATSGYNDGLWHLATATYDGSTARVYVDGTLSISAPVSVSLTTSPIYVGQITGGGGFYWNGTLDEVGLWGRALNASEVAALYNGGAGRSPNDQVTLSAGALGLWHLDEGSGSTTTDAIAGQALTLNAGASWTATGVSGSALAFSGSNSASGPWAKLTGNAPRTLSAWIRTTTAQSGTVALSWGDPTTAKTASSICINSATTVGFCSGANDLGYAATYADGNWHLVTDTWDGSRMSVYFDGNRIGSGTLPSTLATTSSAIAVGATSGNTYGFAGSVDEAGVWNRALTPSEVQALYLTTSAPTLAAGSAFAVAGQPFNASAAALMGASKAHLSNWAVTGGSLPSGIYLDPATGGLSGTAPSTTGTYVASIQAVAPNGVTGTGSLTVTVGTSLRSGAATFDGSSGFVTLPAGVLAGMYDGSSFQGYTVEGWVNFADSTSGARFYDFASGAAGSNEMSAGRAGTTANVYGQVGATQINGGTIANGTWQHLAVSQTGTTLTVYLNGASVVTTGGSVMPAMAARALQYLGKSTYGSSDPLFRGSMADVQVYGRGLSTAEVASTKAGGTLQGIVSRYFAGSAGAADGAGANGGTITGSVTFPGTSSPY